MEKNILFYFSGTGNSLKAAKNISNSLENCELVSMGKPYTLSGGYNRIGFIFPSYCMGAPMRVERFLAELDLSGNEKAYYFSIVTCGNAAGNAFANVDKALNIKGLVLHYGKSVSMFSNYVVLYGMANDAAQRAIQSDKIMQPFIQDIVKKKIEPFLRGNIAFELLRTLFLKSFPSKDKGFRVSDSCTGCKACQNVCPVGNIAMKNKKPVFLHKCEQCMACIQWCPTRSIEYKNKTQSRGRYHHPDISLKEMSKK